MMRCFCGFVLKDNKKCTELRELLGIAPVSLVIERGRLDMLMGRLDMLNINTMLSGLSDVCW